MADRLRIGADVATATLKDAAAARAFWAPSNEIAIFYADDGQTIPSPAWSAWAPLTPGWR